MGSIRRLLYTFAVLWILVATNPGPSSFRHFLTNLHRAHLHTPTCQKAHSRDICLHARQAFPHLSAALESIFAPHRQAPSWLPDGPPHHFEVVDCAVFTLARTRLADLPDRPRHNFIGILATWLPLPHTARLLGSVESRNVVRYLRRRVALVKRAAFDQDLRSFEAFRERSLPDRPWEWLIVYFAIVGALWFMFPQHATQHFTLTWQNVRLKGNWWCMILFHLSHGGSLLRLCRTVGSISFLAPILISRRILNLSGMYGVLLTSSATSTALGMLVLARRYVFMTRESGTRSPIEINGGGACVYALLVAACLAPDSNRSFPGGARPFELLMLNVLFDSFFLAGKRKIADYIAHTGAALGSWLFCSINQSSEYVS